MRNCSNSIGLFFAVVSVVALATPVALTAADSPTAPPSDITAGATPAVATIPAKKADVPQPPVQVSSDEAEYFNKEGLVIFTGNVVAVQADSTITAERMEVTFEKPAGAAVNHVTGPGAPSGAQRIKTIVAEKKVSLRQIDAETKKERYATGDKGVYDVDQRIVTMSGNPRLWEGKNVIVGEEMVFHLDDKKVSVKGKVNLTVYPDELKDEKKEKKEEKKP